MSGYEQRAGDYRVVCTLSGFQAWASECVKLWDGQYALRRFAGSETQRHPQEFIRAIPDRPSVPWSQSETTDVFLNPGDVTPSDL